MNSNALVRRVASHERTLSHFVVDGVAGAVVVFEPMSASDPRFFVRSRAQSAVRFVDTFALHDRLEDASRRIHGARKSSCYKARMQDLAHLSDDELATELFACCFDLRRLTARALAYLGEVEDRRIDLKSACSSLHEYCRRKLSMSDGQAHRHVMGARLARRYPFLLERIESGELCLTTLVHIKDFITDDNVHELLADCVGKTRNQVDRMLGERFGKEPSRYAASADLVPYDRELEKMMARARELLSHAVPNGDPVELAKRAFTLLIEQAEKEKRGKADKPRPAPAETSLAKATDAKASERTPARTKTVPRAAIRAMFARYGEECSYVDERTGECCRSRAFLQIEHIDPLGLGGTHDVENLRPLCRAHNRLLAELIYGRDYVERRINARRSGARRR